MQAMIVTAGAMLLACSAVWNNRSRIVAEFPEPQRTWGTFALAGGMLLGILVSTSESRAELTGPIGLSVAIGVLFSLHVLALKAPRVPLLAAVLAWVGFFCIALILSIVSAFTPD